MWKTVGTNPDESIQSAINPKQLESKSISRNIRGALYKQQILLPKESVKSEDLSNTFRSFFKAICKQAGMSYQNIELLTGNNKGISDSYYKPTEQEIFEDYLKAVDLLTINKDLNQQ